MQQQPEQLQDDLVNVDPDVIENGHVPIEDEVFAPNNEDGMIVLLVENIISDEEGLVESEDEEAEFDAYVPEVAIEDRVVAIAALDDEETDVVNHTRPRRENIGAGVESMQMNFSRKGYGSKCEFNFTTNGIKVNPNTDNLANSTSYVELALDIIFTQMSANAGFKKIGEPAFAKERSQGNQLLSQLIPKY